LLDEMGALAEGDLTVKATFGGDATGALADSINFIAQQLGARIQALTAPITAMSTQSEASRNVAIQCAELSQYQLQELDAALARLRTLRSEVNTLQRPITTPLSQEAVLGAARECASACTDLMAMLETLHTVTTKLGAEASRGVGSLDVLAQSLVVQREAAEGFILPR